MALFKSNPEKTMQRDIDAARSDCATLTARLNGAEKSVIERQDEAERLACDNAEDGVLGKAEAAVRVAQDHVKNLRGGLSKKQQQIAALERDFSALIDTRTRHETAAEVATMATNLENAAKKFDTAVAELAEIAGRAASFIPDGLGLQRFAASSRAQVPPAVELVAVLMRGHAEAVLNGSGSATLPRNEPVVVQAKAPTPQSVKIFLIQPIKFLDPATNGVKTWPAFHPIDLPAELATRALARKAAVLADHETAKRAMAKGGGNTFEWPDPARCISLDGEEKTADQPVVFGKVMQSLPAGFEPLDRGGPFIIKTAAGNAAPEAT
jgi:hypothetical protein